VQNGAGDGGTRGWVAALEVGRARNCGAVRRPSPATRAAKPGKTTTTPGKPEAAVIWANGSYDPASRLYIVARATRSRSTIPQASRATTSTPTRRGGSTSTPASRPGISSTRRTTLANDEVGVHMLYDATVQRRAAQIVGHFAPHGFYYTLDRRHRQVHQGRPVRERSQLTKGINPKPAGRSITIRSSTCRSYIQWRGRCARRQEARLPDLHGGVAHQPTAYHPVKKNRLRGPASKAASRRTGRPWRSNPRTATST